MGRPPQALPSHTPKNSVGAMVPWTGAGALDTERQTGAYT